MMTVSLSHLCGNEALLTTIYSQLYNSHYYVVAPRKPTKVSPSPISPINTHLPSTHSHPEPPNV